jgi:hypothetical protein
MSVRLLSLLSCLAGLFPALDLRENRVVALLLKPTTSNTHSGDGTVGDVVPFDAHPNGSPGNYVAG